MKNMKPRLPFCGYPYGFHEYNQNDWCIYCGREKEMGYEQDQINHIKRDIKDIKEILFKYINLAHISNPELRFRSFEELKKEIVKAWKEEQKR